MKNFFMGPKNGMLMTNAFWSMRSKYFPRKYAEKMINTWALSKENGFYGEFFPLAMAKPSMKAFTSQADLSFGYTPDTAYFTLDGMFRQGFAKVASELTLNHLENYNYHDEWKIPVAPEAYRRNLDLFGDQYSNFNAGKILLFLEGLAGISYSLPEGIFHVRDAMPTAWEWMELEIPMRKETVWTNVRIERQKKAGGITKTIEVRNCPLEVKLEPWLEGRKLDGEPNLDLVATSRRSKRHSVTASLLNPLVKLPSLPYPFFLNDDEILSCPCSPCVTSDSLLLPKTAKPNVIFVLADDLGWAELGCYGNTFHETPHLDKLAKQGIRFTHAYAAAPVCSPYRAALLTGQHPARVGILDYLRPNSSNALPVSHVTLPKILRRNGYATGMAGKWHLTGYKYQKAKFEVRPTAHGFDWNTGSEVKGVGNGANFWPYVFRTQPIRWLDLTENRLGDKEYLTDRLNLEAVEFVERNKDKPFFLYLSHYAPHSILNGRPDLVEKYRKKHPPGPSERDKCYLCQDAGVKGDARATIGPVTTIPTLPPCSRASTTVSACWPRNWTSWD